MQTNLESSPSTGGKHDWKNIKIFNITLEFYCFSAITCSNILFRISENDSYRCSWSALDFSVDPPRYRSFVAVFSSVESFQEFKDTFYEGKELAEQSEILEQPEATAGQGQLY